MSATPAILLMVGLAWAAPPDAEQCFRITVVDEQTGRGVPLVELKTTDGTRYYTDSHGCAAFFEPGLMDQDVFFHVKSHGYEYPRDGFGFAGKTLRTMPGGSAELTIKRVNIAERLYRVTGAGIYRDSVLSGQSVPIRQPLLNGLVTGSDSVSTTVYHGKVYWLWGDTNRPSYPLGNFHMSGATSLLPADGGLDPVVGVNLTYFVDDNGFAKSMAPLPGDGPTWLDGLVTLRQPAGRERMFAVYAKVRANMEAYERGWTEFNDDQQQFEKVASIPRDAPIVPGGHPFIATTDGVEYVYFSRPFPVVRVRATRDALIDLSQYEAFTCLERGSRLGEHRIERNADGTPRYAWKRDTPPIGPQEQAALIEGGHLKPEDVLLQLQDADTGKPVRIHGGSVYWNAYRQRWIMIAVEIFGTSFLGEVWYAEADTLLGPWVYARKIVTHDDYSFYNPKQHPRFDQQGGRIIFFEGTYSQTFSGNKDPTPRYDYNQIMYRLDLADARLALPVPVYDVSTGAGGNRFATGPPRPAQARRRKIAFFALDRPRDGAVHVLANDGGRGSMRLRVGESSATAPAAEAAASFYMLETTVKDAPATTVPLYEFIDEVRRVYAYSTDPTWNPEGYKRRDAPLGLVWRNPMKLDIPAD
jgi:hypothetical protein